MVGHYKSVELSVVDSWEECYDFESSLNIRHLATDLNRISIQDVHL